MNVVCDCDVFKLHGLADEAICIVVEEILMLMCVCVCASQVNLHVYMSIYSTDILPIIICTVWPCP